MKIQAPVELPTERGATPPPPVWGDPSPRWPWPQGL
eukprot:CAMPEP_0172622556 /NCGR_PEP_ID=MMETSP1068-20121228/121331_1 /TAXON_ID=35684 /ORGANISM="Pseudopedinella elastica, Strain CCMP716" /LENGTH=35 /DNA_ID= /DNA_START= /DNA_END= /DNA_ORIENTATION=